MYKKNMQYSLRRSVVQKGRRYSRSRKQTRRKGQQRSKGGRYFAPINRIAHRDPAIFEDPGEEIPEHEYIAMQAQLDRMSEPDLIYWINFLSTVRLETDTDDQFRLWILQQAWARLTLLRTQNEM